MHYPRHCLAHCNTSSNITNTIHFSTPPTLAHQPPYPCWHTNHVTLVAMSPTLACQPRNPSQHATHASTLPWKHATHATNASMPPTQARHPRQHVQHAISQTQCGISKFHFKTLVFALCFNFALSIVEMKIEIPIYFKSLVSNNTRTLRLKKTSG